MEREADAQTTHTAYALTDWDQYFAGRPAYPASLAQLITAYHASHSSETNRLVDIGSGVGIGSLQFAPNYPVVHLSDPSHQNIEQAPLFVRAQLRKQSAALPRIETSICEGESIHQHVAASSTDLAICATAAHFMDGPALARSVARILKPQATFACFVYGTPFFPDMSVEFGEAFNDSLATLLGVTSQPDEARDAPIFSRAWANLTSGMGGLDFVAFEEDLYEDVVRVRINIRPGAPISSWPWMARSLVEIEAHASQVRPRDQIRDYRSGAHAEAEGWSGTTDRHGLRQLLASLEGSRDRHQQQGKSAEERWECLLVKEAPFGNIKMVWPVYISLATRK